jgi:hypothetical protein
MLPYYLERVDLSHALGAAALAVRMEDTFIFSRAEVHFWSAAKATLKAIKANRAER